MALIGPLLGGGTIGGAGEPSPPEPVSAESVTGGIDVVFSEALEEGALDETNWTWRASSLRFIFTSATAVGDTVQCRGATFDGADAGIDGVSYAASPADVTGATTGLDAEAFTDFPL